KPRAGNPAAADALDRQRVTDCCVKALLENARDAVALQFVFEVRFFRRDVRWETAFLPSVIESVLVGGDEILRIHVQRTGETERKRAGFLYAETVVLRFIGDE